MERGEMSQKKVDRLFLLSVMVLIVLWGLLTFNKGAPTPDSWNILWANMILDGRVPYRDFELVYFPTYAYINAAIVAVFGDGLIVFRAFGVLLLVIMTVVAYRIFRLLFQPRIAAVATLLAIFLTQFENTRFNYDYHIFSNIFAYLVLFFVLRTVINVLKEKGADVRMDLFLAGLFCGIGLTIRQTTGLVMIVFVTVALLLLRFYLNRCHKEQKLGLKKIVLFHIGFLVPIITMFAILAMNGLLGPCLEMAFGSGAKGSFFNMLTVGIQRALFNSIVGSILILAILVLSTLFCIRYFSGHRAEEEARDDKADPVYLSFLVIIAAITVIVCMFASISYAYALSIYGILSSLLSLVFALNLALGVALLYIMIKRLKQKKEMPSEHVAYLFVCGFLFTYGYGGGISGTITITYCALMFGLIVALIINESSKESFLSKADSDGTFVGDLKKRLRPNIRHIAVAAALLIIVGGAAGKASMTFSWWLTSEPYPAHTYTSEIDYFKGIKLTYAEREMYEDYMGWVNLNLGDEDELYCYPCNANFYTLAGKIPNVFAPIPWMDVSTEKAILADLEYLKANNPKMIVFMDYGELYLQVHEDLYNGGEPSAHRLLHEWLWDCMDNGDYEILGTYYTYGIPIHILLRI